MSLYAPDWFLPLARAASAVRGSRAAEGAARRRRVIVVDADDKSRAWYSGQARVMGHEVDEARDAAAAISILKTHPEAVVLAHFSAFPDEEQNELRQYLADHQGLSIVLATTPVPEERPASDEQDTVPIRTSNAAPEDSAK